MWSRPLENHLTPLLYWATKSSWPQKWGGWGGLLSLLPHNQQLTNFYLQVFHSFQGQSLLLRCYKVSVLDAIPSCVMASLCAKQGGGFAFCLMPMHEEAILGPDPVFPISDLFLFYLFCSYLHYFTHILHCIDYCSFIISLEVK